ncbi:MAG: ATP-binding protein, partial [Eubacteriales bacterium]
GASAQNGAVRFSVRDNGPGIPEDELPYIWDRYYTSRSRRNPAAVSGLGLSIARELLTLHGARFGADSGPGCVFWFELPRA